MPRVGEVKCLNPRCTCPDVAVSQTPANALAAKCHKCGFEFYGKNGTKARRDFEAIYTPDASDAPPAPPPPAKKQSKEPAPPAAPAARASGLVLG